MNCRIARDAEDFEADKVDQLMKTNAVKESSVEQYHLKRQTSPDHPSMELT